MYIFTTLEFSTHYLNFHLLTTSVNAKYCIETCAINRGVQGVLHVGFKGCYT